jgi:hypothetical protein
MQPVEVFEEQVHTVNVAMSGGVFVQLGAGAIKAPVQRFLGEGTQVAGSA